MHLSTAGSYVRSWSGAEVAQRPVPSIIIQRPLSGGDFRESNLRTRPKTALQGCKKRSFNVRVTCGQIEPNNPVVGRLFLCPVIDDQDRLLQSDAEYIRCRAKERRCRLPTTSAVFRLIYSNMVHSPRYHGPYCLELTVQHRVNCSFRLEPIFTGSMPHEPVLFSEVIGGDRDHLMVGLRANCCI